MPTEYRPGACNIGQAERRVRYGFAAVGFLAAAALVLAVTRYAFPRWVLWLTIAPLLGGFVSFYQAREAFCVGYAVAGVYNLSDRIGEHGQVSDSEALRSDRRQALRLVARATVSATAVTILLYLIVPA